jgi:5'-methylthioadenosine phosphorylase
VDVIGMTNLPEAKLAREAGMCYATMALVTDFDCWHPGHDAVTVEAIIATLHQNVTLSRRIIRAVTQSLTGPRPCGCSRALETAVLTARDKIPAAARKRLALLLDKPPTKTAKGT